MSVFVAHEKRKRSKTGPRWGKPMTIATVILPAHREGPLLEVSVASVIGQSWPHWVMRLVLDRPSSATRAIATRLSVLDQRIELVEVDHGNLGRVLADEGARAETEFMIRMDADDVAYRHRFANQISFMRDNPDVVVSGSNARLIDSENRPFGYTRVPKTHGDILSLLLTGVGSAIIHPSSIFRTEALLSCGGYDSELRRGQDLDVYLKLSAVGRMANISDVLLDFRKHPLSSTFAEDPEVGIQRRNRTIKTFVETTGYDNDLPQVEPPIGNDQARFTAYVLLKSLRTGFLKTFIHYFGIALKNRGIFMRAKKILWKKVRHF